MPPVQTITRLVAGTCEFRATCGGPKALPLGLSETSAGAPPHCTAREELVSGQTISLPDHRATLCIPLAPFSGLLLIRLISHVFGLSLGAHLSGRDGSPGVLGAGCLNRSLQAFPWAHPLQILCTSPFQKRRAYDISNKVIVDSKYTKSFFMLSQPRGIIYIS